eukprot:SAG11_NODE_2757_length_3006_cov_3.489164_3_plen_138_part_00
MHHEENGPNAHKPSVEKAMEWFFDTVLRRSSSRVWRTANMLYYSRDSTSESYVSSIRNLDIDRDYSTSTHFALPFAFLRDIVTKIPQQCLIGTICVISQMLPQGSGISVPASMIKAAYRRNVISNLVVLTFLSLYAT